MAGFAGKKVKRPGWGYITEDVGMENVENHALVRGHCIDKAIGHQVQLNSLLAEVVEIGAYFSRVYFNCRKTKCCHCFAMFTEELINIFQGTIVCVIMNKRRLYVIRVTEEVTCQVISE
jgi:hypothetical protein